jgi:hypothetical protein
MLSQSEMFDLIERWLPSGPKGLDVGCGSERVLRALVEYEILSLEIDPYAG